MKMGSEKVVASLGMGRGFGFVEIFGKEKDEGRILGMWSL